MQSAAVFVIVLCAAVYAAWRLPGPATRLRYAAGLKRIGLRALGARLEARVLRALAAGGCQACGAATRDSVHKPSSR